MLSAAAAISLSIRGASGAWNWFGKALVLAEESGREREVPLELHGVDVSEHRALFTHPTVVSAAQFAAQAHAGQFRRTGEPYVVHGARPRLPLGPTSLTPSSARQWWRRRSS
jgi:hypothetical protein